MTDAIAQQRFRTPEAAKYLNISASTLEKFRVFGGGPAYFKLARLVLYDKAELDKWLAARLRLSTTVKAAEAA